MKFTRRISERVEEVSLSSRRGRRGLGRGGPFLLRLACASAVGSPRSFLTGRGRCSLSCGLLGMFLPPFFCFAVSF